MLGPCPVPEAIARCDALGRDAEPTGRLSLLGGRAVLMAMLGRYDEARGDMARARAGFADLRLDVMAAYLALAVAHAEILTGDLAAAERAVRDAGAMGGGAGDRWYESMITVELANTIIAQGRDVDAAAAVARIDAVPASCDLEWLAKRHVARARFAARAGDHAGAIEEARDAVTVAEPTGLFLLRADTYRTLAEVLREAGQPDEAAAAASGALALDEAKEPRRGVGNAALPRIAAHVNARSVHPPRGPWAFHLAACVTPRALRSAAEVGADERVPGKAARYDSDFVAQLPGGAVAR